LGAITPLGKSVAEYWQGLSDGVNGCDFIKQFDPLDRFLYHF